MKIKMFCLFLLLPLCARAQVARHEIGLAVSSWPGGINAAYDTKRDEMTERSRLYGPSFRDCVPIFSADYQYNFTSHWAVGGVLGVSHLREESGSYLGLGTTYLVMPQVRFTWKNFRHARLYSRVAAGLVMDYTKLQQGGAVPDSYVVKDHQACFSAHLGVFGFDVGGRRVRFFGELGLGVQGIALGGFRVLLK